MAETRAPWWQRTADFLSGRTALVAMQQRGADPTLPWGNSVPPLNSQTGFTSAGLQITDDTAMSIAAIYTCVSILADSVSSLPIVCYEKGDTGRVVVDAPLLIADPWPEGTAQDWMQQVVFSLALRGNFYGLIVDRDPASGVATMIQPVHPDAVSARRDGQGRRQYWIFGKPVATADVLHIPNLLSPGSFIGLNPIDYMRQSWALAYAAEKYGAQFFANSATPTGAILVEEDLTEEETLELARSWRMQHGGLQGAGLPAVLTGGAKFEPISITPDQAQFINSRQMSRQEIAGIFKIPPHKMGNVDRTPQALGNEEQELAFVTDALMPYLVKIETYLSKLCPPGIECKFDLTARLRGNQGQRFTNYTMAINNGFMTADEARKAEDWDPLPDGQGKIVWRPLNFAPASKILDGSADMSGNGGQGGGMDQHPDGGGAAPNPPNNPKSPVPFEP